MNITIHKITIRICIGIIFSILIGYWYDPPRDNLIYFVISVIGVGILFGIFSDRIQKISFILERILFYFAMIMVASIIIPLLDASVMSIASFIFESWPARKESDDQSDLSKNDKQ